MEVESIMLALRVQGAAVRATNGMLHVQAPNGLPPVLQETMKAQKPAILAYLGEIEVEKSRRALEPVTRRVYALEDAGRADTDAYDAALYDYLIKLVHYEAVSSDAIRYREGVTP